MSKWKVLVLLAILAYVAVPKGKSDQWIRDRVVRIHSSLGSCTGEQVRAPSGKDYILTAGHCSGLIEDGKFHIITENGDNYYVGLLEESPTTDLMLLEGLPHLDGIRIAPDQERFDSVRTFTHGQDFDTYETDGVVVDSMDVEAPISPISDEASRAKCLSMPKNKIASGFLMDTCNLDVEETVTTAKVVPGSSGGPSVDSRGRLSGVVSGTNEHFGFMVSLDDIEDFLAKR